jgi:SagB-type dehydrogenase family enzyme
VKTKLDSYLEPAGFEAPALEHVEIFHESTKLSRTTEAILARRIMEYLSSERGRLEISRNRRRYVLAPKVALPPCSANPAPLAECLANRRSVRRFMDRELTLQQLSNVLGAARVRQKGEAEARAGIDIGLRAYPSGGGLYPIETYVALVDVEGLRPCLAHYDPHAHELQILDSALEPQNLLEALGGHAGSTPRAPAVLFACALFERSVVKYGNRGYRFSMLEAGMLTYLYSLAAVSMGLGTVNWGGFLDDTVHDLFDLDGIGEAVVDTVLLGVPEPAP